jgi:hypothetical protein
VDRLRKGERNKEPSPSWRRKREIAAVITPIRTAPSLAQSAKRLVDDKIQALGVGSQFRVNAR